MKAARIAAVSAVWISILTTLSLNSVVVSADPKNHSSRDQKTNTVESNNGLAPNTAEVIYGEDDRQEPYELTNSKTRQLADSTLALFNAIDIRENTDGTSTLLGNHYGEHYGLCSEERFYNQTTAAFCSGFLISDELIVTAGHCVANEFSCQATRFVFGFAKKSPEDEALSISNSDVYQCKELLHSQAIRGGADFAIIRLDRPVRNHAPLNMNKRVDSPKGTPLVVIGHPSGLPLKVADGASIRKTESHNGYFVANLDTYGGNSGSAVFNENTGEVEGILVRGEKDYVRKDNCRISHVCPDDGCRGEDVTKIQEVVRTLNALPLDSETIYSKM